MKTKSKPTYAEMIAERDRLDAAITQARADAIETCLAEVRHVIATHGFAQREIMARLMHGKRRYRMVRNPDTGETARLTGRTPKWLAARIKAGASVDDFVI